jgi:hypothetical protein
MIRNAVVPVIKELIQVLFDVPAVDVDGNRRHGAGLGREFVRWWPGVNDAGRESLVVQDVGALPGDRAGV